MCLIRQYFVFEMYCFYGYFIHKFINTFVHEYDIILICQFIAFMTIIKSERK